MTDSIILQRIIRDPKRVFTIGRYIIPKVRDDGKKMDNEEEYLAAIKRVTDNPNFPNFQRRLNQKMIECGISNKDECIFEYFLEFPLIIEDRELFNKLLGEESTKHHWRADILFSRLNIIVELDSSWHSNTKVDAARDKYIKHVWGIKTLRVELGLQDNPQNKETLDSRFEEVWKVLYQAYKEVLKGRVLLSSGKPGNLEMPTIINYYPYLIREFRREEKDTIKLCEKYLESQPGFFTMDSVVLYISKLEKKDRKLFDDPLSYIRERLQKLVSYIYEKDLRFVEP